MVRNYKKFVKILIFNAFGDKNPCYIWIKFPQVLRKGITKGLNKPSSTLAYSVRPFNHPQVLTYEGELSAIIFGSILVLRD